MITAWIFIIVGIIVICGGLYWAFVAGRNTQDRVEFIIVGIIAIDVGLILAGGTAFWLYGTEGGAREQKSFQSTTCRAT